MNWQQNQFDSRNRPDTESRDWGLVQPVGILLLVVALAAAAVARMSSQPEGYLEARVRHDLRAALAAAQESYAETGSYEPFSLEPAQGANSNGFRPSKGVSVTGSLEDEVLMIVGGHESSNRTWCVSTTNPEIVEGNDC